MPNLPTNPKGPSLQKAFEKALLGGLTGFVSGLAEDVMGPSKQSDYGEIDVAHNNAVRREQIATKILAGLAANMASPLEQPDRLVSMAVDLANKLIARLDEEAKLSQSETDALKKKIETSVLAQIHKGTNQFAPTPFVANPFVPNPLAPNQLGNNQGVM